MQGVVCESRSEGLMVLADEFREDPRCVLMIAGADDHGFIVFSLWSGDVAAEVAEGLGEHERVDVVRLVDVPDGAAYWP